MSFLGSIDDIEARPQEPFRVNSSDTVLGPYDANVLLATPQWIFTSPNRPDIPHVVLDPQVLCARADGRFGLEDYALWPQLHSEAYPWAPCILRKPPPEQIPEHQFWFLWDDLSETDWIRPPSSSWDDAGVLLPAYHTHFAQNMQDIVQRVLHAAPHDTLPLDVSVTVNALHATLARLRDLPMSFRDLVLQFTQAQRLALDLMAMETYHHTMFARMMQRAHIHELRPELVGCYTNNPTTVENMYYAGIPVVYVRSSSTLAPSHLRVLRIAEEFATIPSDIITAQWHPVPCRQLHTGASCTRRILMSRTLGRYFEDLIPLGDIPPPITEPSPESFEELSGDARAVSPASGPQRFTRRGHTSRVTKGPSQQPVQLTSRKGRKLEASRSLGRSAVHSKPSVPGVPLTSQRSKFSMPHSPFMPPISPPWLAALRAVYRDGPVHATPKSKTGLMYPDPGHMASVSDLNRAVAVSAWLSIRAARCGQMLHPASTAVPVLSTSAWRSFFFLYRRTPDAAAMLDRNSPHYLAIQAATAMFGAQAVSSMHRSMTEVFWRGRAFSVVEGVVQNIDRQAVREIIWELAELNWRYELLALDKLAAPQLWLDDTSAGQRITDILLVFSPSACFVLTHAPFPTENTGIVADLPSDRRLAMRALRRVMVSWRECPHDVCRDASSDPAVQHDELYYHTMDAVTMGFYCQTFYEYFHRAPIIPCQLP